MFAFAGRAYCHRTKARESGAFFFFWDRGYRVGVRFWSFRIFLVSSLGFFFTRINASVL